MKRITLLTIAIMCHNMNRAVCIAFGDNSQPDWDDLTDDLKDSTMDGVRFVLENPEATPADQHQNWMDTRIADGWQYGEEKDVENKIHPCLVPYEELPEAQKAKDHIFRATVENMMKLERGDLS